MAQYNRDLMTALALSPVVGEITILPRVAPAQAVSPTKVRQLSPAAGRARWSARALALSARRQFDLVFCGHLKAIPVAAAIARLQRKPLWMQVHGVEAWQSPGLVHRRALARAELVTSVSRHTRRKFLTWSDVAPHRARVLPNTFRSTYAPRAVRRDLAARHGLDGRQVILTVGRLSSQERYKGHDRLIEALPEILARAPNTTYLIVGSGDDSDRLAQLAREKNVADHVVFAGYVPDADIPDYFALADVFAMPSTGEGFGIVFLEAAASGLPVIAGDRDGSVDALADGAIGRLIDPGSREQIVGAVLDALSGGVERDRGAVSRFAFDNFSSQVDELVRNFVR